MAPQDYFIKHDKECYLGFKKNTADFWLLGDNFFRGFYMIHDDANGMLGIAPHSTSTKEEIKWGAIPDKVLPNVNRFTYA